MDKMDFVTWLKQVEYRIEGILIITALFGIIAPFTSLNTPFAQWVLGLESSWMSWNPSQLTHGNPLWMTLQGVMLQLVYCLEYAFPTFFGTNNSFLVRFFLKVPLLALYLLSAFLFEETVKKYTNNDHQSKLAFYTHLANAPLFYTVAVWGSPEVVTWTFVLVALLLWLDGRDNPQVERILVSGFFFGVGISLHFFVVLLLPLFIYPKELKTGCLFLLGVATSLAVVLGPWLFLFQGTAVEANTQTFGFSILWQSLVPSVAESVLWVVLFGVVCYLYWRRPNQIKAGSFIIVSLLVLTPNLKLSHFLIFSQFILVFTFVLYQGKWTIRLPEFRYSPSQLTFSAPKTLVIVAPMFILTFVLLFMSYPTLEVFHISLIQVSSPGIFNQELTFRTELLAALGILISLLYIAVMLFDEIMTFLNRSTSRSTRHAKS